MIRTITLAIPMLLALSAMAQEEKKDDRPLGDRLWFGGNIGLLFGNVTFIQLDPMVGYKVDREGRFMVGTGPSYWHFADKRFTPTWTFTGYGYRVFSRYRFIEQAFAHAEFLNMNVDGARNELFGPLDQRIWVPHLLVGGGYIQRMGGRSGIVAQVLFEVLQDPNSVYYGMGPIVSVGVGLGF
ncbi:MAG: hypothetical protein KIT10_14270 [Flavobacteriales bacterium]|nr:hypothetical protein [Flavobacteriales bacterium]